MELTPRMVRIEFGGAGLDGFTAGEFTDHYVKIQSLRQTRITRRPSTRRRSELPVRESLAAHTYVLGAPMGP